MIDQDTFDRVRRRHGGYASWAVWADPAPDKPKSNIGDMRVLDPEGNPALLQTLRTDVVMIGLNISRSFCEPLRNFHDPRSMANDFKIRYAFANTAYYGAYMTDIVKHVEMVHSSSLVRYLKKDPSVVVRNVTNLLAEFDDLQCIRPTILAFGTAAHALVAEHVPSDRYSRLVRLTHYSHRISKEEYRQTVFREIVVDEPKGDIQAMNVWDAEPRTKR
jgi:hypothetical protein